MSIRKILIDVSEYERLKEIEEKYEAMLKTKLSGSGIDNGLDAPLLTKDPPITDPPSASLEVPKLIDTVPPVNAKKRPWYFLGKNEGK